MHRAVGVHNQAAVGLVAEQRLRDAEHDERIQSATDDGEDQRDHHGAAEFREQFFINLDTDLRINTDDAALQIVVVLVLVIEAASNRGRGRERGRVERVLQVVSY